MIKGLYYFALIQIVLLSKASCAQDAIDFQYRYDTDALPNTFHQQKRNAISDYLGTDECFVAFTNPIRNRSNDNDFQYHQDPNFYYLTGFKEPDAVLIIFNKNDAVREILFVPKRNPEREVWNGRRAGIEKATLFTGIDSVCSTEDFISFEFPKNISHVCTTILPSGIVDDKNNKFDLYNILESFHQKIERQNLANNTQKIKNLLSELREVKEAEELVLMQKAIDISCDAHIAMMKGARSGMHEYEVQAVGEYFFKKEGSEYVGYPSICGAAENGTILHYNTNRKKTTDNELVLLDMGAEYHGYTADITRTLPLNGKFSDDQKALYNLVLEAQNAGIAACVMGGGFRDPHEAAVEKIKAGLLKLEIIKNAADYKRYFMHSTSHYLGLDVHDVGTRGSLKANSVITVEPGIYIPEGSPCHPKWWNMGIRIEDDILITNDKPLNMSAKAPRTIEEIEKIMQQQLKETDWIEKHK